jgi:hypothetical protein
MTDPGPSIADIQAARNHKISAEFKADQETNRIAEELQGAHQDALHLKEHIRESEGQGAVPHQQVCQQMLHATRTRSACMLDWMYPLCSCFRLYQLVCRACGQPLLPAHVWFWT